VVASTTFLKKQQNITKKLFATREMQNVNIQSATLV